MDSLYCSELSEERKGEERERDVQVETERLAKNVAREEREEEREE